MADSWQELIDKQIELEKAMGSTSTAMAKMEQDYLTWAKAARDEIKNTKLLKDGLGALISVKMKHSKILRDQLQEMIKANKENKAFQREQEKMQQIIERNSKGLGAYKDGFESLAGGMKKATGAVVGFASSMGVASISMGSLAKAGMDYDKGLFQLSRTQQVAGRGGRDLGAALAYVKKNTVLAKSEFVELANIIQNSFLGLKPSLMETANLTKLIAAQVGPSFDTQKESAQKLLQIQNQFPSIYEDIISSMKTIEKLSSGQGSAGDKERIKSARELMTVKMQESGMGQDLVVEMLKLTTILTAEEQKRLGVLTEQQKLSKAFRDAEIETYEALKPLLTFAMEYITKIVQVGIEWKDTIIAAAASLAILRTAQIAFNIVAAKNPYVLIAAGITSAILGIIAMVNHENIANKTAAEGAKIAQFQAKQQKDIASLSGEKLKNYQEEWNKVKDTTSSIEEQEAAHEKILKGVKEEKDSVDKMRLKYGKIMVDVGKEVDLLNKVTGSLKTQASLMEEFGGISREALAGLIKMAEVTKDRLGVGLKSALNAITEGYKYLDKDIIIPVDFKADIGTQSKQMDDFLKAQFESTTNEDKKNDIMAKRQGIADSLNKYQQAEGDIVRATISDVEKQIRLQERFTSLYESRLDTERKLMESAQFGLGASVEMMQKQVDLAYQLMQTYAKADKDFQSRIKTEKLATAEQIKRIQNAKTQAEAEDIIKNTIGGSAEQQGILLQYAAKHQEYTKKTMDQQQKIYDLTKDIREGYLDAIREMATGAGEFEKIIGTQDMGVTQLMDSVKGVTGMSKLNTMALGGLQEQSLTKQGVGTEYTGQYTAGGVSFIGGQTQEQRNQRIYGFNESRNKLDAIRRGEIPGASDQSRVGQANVPGAENYIAPEREAEIQGKIMGKEIANQLSSPNYLSAVNRGVKEQRFNRGEAAKIEATAETSGVLGAGLLYGSNAPARASGGARRSSSGQGLDVVEDATGRRVYGQRVGVHPKKVVEPLDSSTLPTSSDFDEVEEINKIRKGRKEYEDQLTSIENLKKEEEKAKKEAIAASSETFAPEKERSRFEKSKTGRVLKGAVGLAFGTGKAIAGNTIGGLKSYFGRSNASVQESLPEWGGGNPIDEARKWADDEKYEDVESETQAKADRSNKAMLKYTRKRREREEAENKNKVLEKEIGKSKEKEKQVLKDQQNAKARSFAVTGSQMKKDEEGNITAVWDPKGKVVYGEGEATGEEAENIRKRSMAEKKRAAREEIQSGAADVRKQLGKVKPKKGQTQGQAEFQAATKLFLKEHVEQYSDEDFKKAQAVQQEIKKSTSPLSKTGYSFSAGKMEGDPTKRKGSTSAAKAQGYESSEEAMQTFNQQAGTREAIYGSTGDAEGGGAGTATITIRLEDGLKANVEDAAGVRVEIVHGASAAA